MESIDLTEIPSIVALLAIIAAALWREQRDKAKTRHELDKIRNKALTAVQNIADRATARVDELTDRLNAQSTQMQELLAQRKADQAAHKAEITALTVLIESKDAKIAELETDHKRTLEAMGRRIQTLEMKVAGLSKTLTVRENTIKALEGENEKLKRAAASHQREQAKWTIERAELKGRIDALESERADLLTRISLIEKRQEKLETDTGTIPVVAEDTAGQGENETTQDDNAA